MTKHPKQDTTLAAACRNLEAWAAKFGHLPELRNVIEAIIEAAEEPEVAEAMKASTGIERVRRRSVN